MHTTKKGCGKKSPVNDSNFDTDRNSPKINTFSLFISILKSKRSPSSKVSIIKMEQMVQASFPVYVTMQVPKFTMWCYFTLEQPILSRVLSQTRFAYWKIKGKCCNCFTFRDLHLVALEYSFGIQNAFYSWRLAKRKCFILVEWDCCSNGITTWLTYLFLPVDVHCYSNDLSCPCGCGFLVFFTFYYDDIQLFL